MSSPYMSLQVILPLEVSCMVLTLGKWAEKESGSMHHLLVSPEVFRKPEPFQAQIAHMSLLVMEMLNAHVVFEFGFALEGCTAEWAIFQIRELITLRAAEGRCIGQNLGIVRLAQNVNSFEMAYVLRLEFVFDRF